MRPALPSSFRPLARTLAAFLALPLSTAAAAQDEPIVEMLAAAQAESRNADIDAKENAAAAKKEQSLASLVEADKIANTPADEAKLDAATDEAREKADIAMAAAQTQLAMGIIQGLLQIGAAAVSVTAQCNTGEGGLVTHAESARVSAMLARTLAQDEVIRLQNVMKELPTAEKKEMRKKIAKAKRSAALHKKTAKKVGALTEQIVVICAE